MEMSNESIRCVPGEAMDAKPRLPVAVRIAAGFQIFLLAIAAIQAVLWLLTLVYIYARLLGGSLVLGNYGGLALVTDVVTDLLLLGAAVGAVWVHFRLARALCQLRRRAIAAALIVSLVYAVGIVLSHMYDLLPLGLYFPILPWGIVPLLPLSVTLPILLGANALTLPYWKRAD